VISNKLLNMYLFSIFYVLYEKLGDELWSVVKEAGKILYREIRKELGIPQRKEVFNVLEKLIDFLVKEGYFEDADIKALPGNIIEYRMKNPVILPSAKRLIELKMVPPHISTFLLFAALEEMGYTAELLEVSESANGWVIEKWRLMRA